MITDKIISEAGAVIIGKNEGERLRRCLASVCRQINNVVYVDSASFDNSCEIAESFEIDVIHLDPRIPLSAARARNAGFIFLTDKYKNIRYIQFIDGDCILLDGWIERALPLMKSNHEWAIIAGKLRELTPGNSIYNTLCDIEWDTPTGDVQSCGGIFIVDTRVFEDAGGFNSDMVAGEEPELCLRLRNLGWRIYKSDIPMAMHDANMTRFSQWWKRAMRSGYGFALGSFYPEANQKYIRNSLSIWFWALFYPGLIFFLSIIYSCWFIAGLLLYCCQFTKLFFWSKKRGVCRTRSLLYSFFMVLIKWPQLLGQVQYFLQKGIAR